jgi:hypothetical protein
MNNLKGTARLPAGRRQQLMLRQAVRMHHDLSSIAWNLGVIAKHLGDAVYCLQIIASPGNAGRLKLPSARSNGDGQ